MNRENIQIVRDHIAGLPRKRFTMERFAAEADTGVFFSVPPRTLAHTCNTAGCVAGWTVALLAKRDGPRGVEFQAAKLLGLSADAGDELFCPVGFSQTGKYSQAHAVRVLDHLLATGEVDWKSTRRAKKATA